MHTNEEKKFYLHFKELMSFRKPKKAHDDDPKLDLPQITVSQVKSDETITTRTLIDEHMFVETEFLPIRPRRQRSISAQVNIWRR